MKYFITFLTFLALVACRDVAVDQQPYEIRPKHLDEYLNRIVKKVPDWGNNDVTRQILEDSLCNGFGRDLQDSNLLSDFIFKIDNIENSVYNDSLDIKLTPLLLTPADTTIKSPIRFKIYSLISDSLGRSLVKNGLYFITSYLKIPSDSICSQDLNAYPPSVAVDNTIVNCDLGLKGIRIQKIEPFTPSTKR